MKISYMLKREDFYKINEETLNTYFDKNDGKTPLYIYPELNAIVKKNPSKDVKEYIYTEFHVEGALYKKVLVWLYTRFCLNTVGLMASKKITIDSDIADNVLIYPCNRKYRIFDFGDNTVSVVVKSGFPNNCLKREIEFRKSVGDCNFILPILEHSETSYTERIIDGIPLARITSNKAQLKLTAQKLWSDYTSDSQKSVAASLYADQLARKIEALKADITERGKQIDFDLFDKAVSTLLNKMRTFDSEIVLSLSHGDFQEGNIWVENGTEKIYIIDWESASTRSVWYDDAVLNDGIRRTPDFGEFSAQNDLKHITVVIEEIIYRMDELCELPLNYGESDFDNLTRLLYERISNV